MGMPILAVYCRRLHEQSCALEAPDCPVTLQQCRVHVSSRFCETVPTMISSMTPLHELELVLLALMIAVASISGVARRFGYSYPIVLVLVGLAVSFVPNLPYIPLPPNVVFLVFLPPLLFSAAWQTSWQEFRSNIFSISLLAFGLVFFTAFGVAYTAHLFLPNFDWRIGFLLGAVVSPTDAVAASSIAKKVGMPRRIVDILEGESLLNDATGLLALEFGVTMLVHGTTPSVGEGLLRFTWLLAGGTAIGLLVGVAVAFCERWIDDGPVEIAISLVVPYACYLSSEAVHSSGVIAVVACGLLMSRQSAHFFSAASRLQTAAVWEALEFLLNGLVFILLGLQLPYVLNGLHEYSRWRLVAYGSAFSLVLISLRLVWVYPGAMAASLLRRLFMRKPRALPPAKGIFVTGWTGMRGVVALAAASSLPYTIEDGQEFLQRNLILFLTFSVILVTLVLQGISLPLLVRLLGFAPEPNQRCEESQARRVLLRAALEKLQAGRTENPEAEHTYADLIHTYEHRLEEIDERGFGSVAPEPEVHSRASLLRGALATEREQLTHLRDEGGIDDMLYRTLERELDLSESRLETMT